MLLRVRKELCVGDQSVPLSLPISATAQEGPMEACIWYGTKYCAVMVVLAALKPESISPEL